MGGGGTSGRRPSRLGEDASMGELNFIIEAHEHVQWPAEGLSSTGAPGQLARPRTFTHESASTPSLLQSALHLPPR